MHLPHVRISDAELRAEVQARHDALADKIVRRLSRGNYNLSRGAYWMRDPEEQKKLDRERRQHLFISLKNRKRPG